MAQQTALITDASSGIGKHLARQFAKNEYPIVGIADAEDSWVTALDSIKMETEDVAEAGFEALMKGDDIIIPGFQKKTLTFTRRIIPKSLQATANK